MPGLATNLKSTRLRPDHYDTKAETASKRPRLRSRFCKLASRPSLLLSSACKTKSISQIIAIVSTVTERPLENIPCANQYSDAKFSILASSSFSIQGRTSFYLSTLEANFIKSFQSNYVDKMNFFTV